MTNLSKLSGFCLSAVMAAATLVLPQHAHAISPETYISFENGTGYFTLSGSAATPIYTDANSYAGVVRAIKNLQADINRVTKKQPEIISVLTGKPKEVVIVGTIGKSAILDQLIKAGKLNVTGVKGHWEASITQVIENPLPGIERALVIAGSDKRGTIYGIYDLSEQIGVSPWYWWADVPVTQHNNLYVLPGRHPLGEPQIKYRGIFINDEAPALSGWTREKNGGFNHLLYEKVFELILRMKGNYLWPAMWGNAFNYDDTLNPKLADEYGIVMGTSHHEPMLRAQQEWKKFGSGAWNYHTNEATLSAFWKKGIENMGTHESIVTIGMRGDGDEPMTEGTHIALMEKIVKDQREIIGQVTGKDPAKVPQLWALYKEVQDYYDKGMRVPDDVTLLLCDDNWGNIRKLPKPGEKQHSGGYGIYYHFDYVGGPRNYKWLNTNPIPKIWEQMHLAYQYNVNSIWLVNVGDIKPMEFPISFFLDYAWNPDKWPQNKLGDYTRLWAEKQFGSQYATPIADILAKYGKYNGRRKPEMLEPGTYSLANYREAETIVAEYNKLAEDAEKIYQSIPAEYKDAYYQLVLYPVKACANLNDLYTTVAKNRLYTTQGRASANELAERAKKLFANDAELSAYYNKVMSEGKWNHFMDQTHIGYTYWQQPDKNTMPEVKNITVPAVSSMGVAIEGTTDSWPGTATGEALLTGFNPYQSQAHYIELFNKGSLPFNYSIKSDNAWITIEPTQGSIEKEQRIWVNVDWTKAPEGTSYSMLTVNGPHKTRVKVRVAINNPAKPKPNHVTGFVETDGYVSIEPEHYTNTVEVPPVQWQNIPDYGRTLSAMTAFPLTVTSFIPAGNSPRLEYNFYSSQSGKVNVQTYLGPTLNFNGGPGLKYAISIDNEEPQVITVNPNKSNNDWEKAVSNNATLAISQHVIASPGEHTLKFWLVDPGLVLQKLVIDFGGAKPSYLGPPESFYRIPGDKK